MTVDSGVVTNKRDIISCCMVSPSQRYKYVFDLKPFEVFLSEFFLFRLTFTTRNLKKPIHLRLPVNEESNANYELCVRQRGIDEEEWTDIDFSIPAPAANGQCFVDVVAPLSAVFVVTSRPKTEVFEVPVQGCLHNSHLCKQISLRFPKKATDICISCEIQIMSMNRANLAKLAKDYPHDMADLIAATDYFHITTSVDQPFRRPVTVKLPLPALVEEDFPQDDVAIMAFVGDSWQLLETLIKFTKSAITFDTRTLGRYCVVLSRPQRRKRLLETFRHIYEEERVVRGEILLFVHVAEQSWTMWVELAASEQVSAVVEMREREGYRHIAKTFSQTTQLEPTTSSFSSRRGSWRQPRKELPKKVERTDIDLVSGRVIELLLTGDVQIGTSDPGRLNTGLRFEERLPQNYRNFTIEPTSTEKCCPLTAQLRCYAKGASGSECIRTFDLDFELEAVKAYLDLEQEVEVPLLESTPKKSPVIESIPSAMSLAETLIANDAASGDAPHIPEKAAKKIPELRSAKRNVVSVNDLPKKNDLRSRASAFARLTKPMKQPREAIRESKVLTGRSLACLAREVEQGLTLAIYLGISDSTITGMGFDALANGQSIVDITYRILLLWKRRSNHYKNKQVDLLADALNDMGRSDLVAVVMDHHRQNIELTPDCFVVSGM